LLLLKEHALLLFSGSFSRMLPLRLAKKTHCGDLCIFSAPMLQ
jgi:hypothetical protein